MAGAGRTSDRVADTIAVKIGARSSRAQLVWPPPGQRNFLKTDMAILELDEDIAEKPFGLAVFQHRDGGTARAALSGGTGAPTRGPGDQGARRRLRGAVVPLPRALVRRFGRDGVRAPKTAEIVPYGFVSAIGSLPGESTRGTAVYGRDGDAHLHQPVPSDACGWRRPHFSSRSRLHAGRALVLRAPKSRRISGAIMEVTLA
jgi:hypothetical protein